MREIWAVVFLCIVGFEVRFIHGATDPSDTLALITLFISMRSPAQLTQWNVAAADPCGQDWKGVTCSGSRVTQINLSGLELSGTLGYMLDKLTSLTELDLSRNYLGGDLPYQLPPNLQRLNLANNQFTGVDEYSISQLVRLEYLNLGHNQFRGQVPIDFTKLHYLKTIDFSSNAFRGSLPGTCICLISLNSLFLQNNQFSGTLDVLAGLPLKTLNVANNDFTGWIPSSLKGITLIKDGNSFSTGPAPPPPPGPPPIRACPSPGFLLSNGFVFLQAVFIAIIVAIAIAIIFVITTFD